MAVAKAYSPVDVWRGFSETLMPRDEDSGPNTKLLVNVLTGGKAAASAVKWSRIYLVMDAARANMAGMDPAEMIKYYQKFLQALKTSIAASKAGDAGFKVLPDGSYFNANATIAESVKMVEDAITATSVNRDEVPEGEEAKGSQQSNYAGGRRIFSIGVSCDADASFNKDPKDANKYEQEGQKNQFDQAGMLDYYMKILGEHPLITYIEDAYAQFDFAGHRMLRERLSNEKPEVQMGLKQCFANGGLARLRQVCAPVDPELLKKQDAMEPGSMSGADDGVRSSIEDKKSVTTPKSGTNPRDARKTPNLATPDLEEIPDFDPEDPYKFKCTPDVAVVNTATMPTVSQLVQTFLFPKGLEEEHVFKLCIQDTEHDRYDTVGIVDLAEGLGAEFLILKGCTKIGKISKVMRFCEMKSALYAEQA